MWKVNLPLGVVVLMVSVPLVTRLFAPLTHPKLIGGRAGGPGGNGYTQPILGGG
jgi:hypothetical protein